jgi:hypothetical protein
LICRNGAIEVFRQRASVDLFTGIANVRRVGKLNAVFFLKVRALHVAKFTISASIPKTGGRAAQIFNYAFYLMSAIIRSLPDGSGRQYDPTEANLL